MRQFNNGFKNKPTTGLRRDCDRTDCLKPSAERVKSGNFTYHLCTDHAKEMTEFEASFKDLRAGMKLYYDPEMRWANKEKQSSRKLAPDKSYANEYTTVGYKVNHRNGWKMMDGF